MQTTDARSDLRFAASHAAAGQVLRFAQNDSLVGAWRFPRGIGATGTVACKGNLKSNIPPSDSFESSKPPTPPTPPALSILFASLTSLAEEPAPKFEVFGGYSFVHTNNGQVDGPALDTLFVQNPGTFSLKTNYSGWNATAQYNANRWLGLAADFGGHYAAPVTRGTRVLGPPHQTQPVVSR